MDKLIEAAKKWAVQRKLSSWNQRTNAEFFAEVVRKLIEAECEEETLVFVLEKAGNASAFRQRLFPETKGAVRDSRAEALADLLS